MKFFQTVACLLLGSSYRGRGPRTSHVGLSPCILRTRGIYRIMFSVLAFMHSLLITLSYINHLLSTIYIVFMLMGSSRDRRHAVFISRRHTCMYCIYVSRARKLRRTYVYGAACM